MNAYVKCFLLVSTYDITKFREMGTVSLTSLKMEKYKGKISMTLFQLIMQRNRFLFAITIEANI